jgi:hypothetical protein
MQRQIHAATDTGRDRYIHAATEEDDDERLKKPRLSRKKGENCWGEFFSVKMRSPFFVDLFASK